MNSSSLFRLSMTTLGGALLLAAPLFAPVCAQAQPAAPKDGGHAPKWPFPMGEVLDYRVNVARGGNIGTGQMRVEGPVIERGVPTWRLVSEMKAKRAFVKATDRTTSWIDPVKFAAMRFEKSERHPLSHSDELIEMDLAAGTWRDDKGEAQALGSPLPLDELSFLYFLRTIPLDREGTHTFNRHFDEARNPTLVTVGAEELVETAAGQFTTRVVIMHVRDPKHYKGVGLIKINIETSSCRIPVRIVSKMPIVGATTLTLVSRTAPDHHCES
ncbi:DUF3108 domain-containing protein [Gemmatimonas sp.]